MELIHFNCVVKCAPATGGRPCLQGATRPQASEHDPSRAAPPPARVERGPLARKALSNKHSGSKGTVFE
ncbi:MAG: hypothetical protein ACREU6_11675, partial [Steroidobacteraceae bacterium]